MSFNNWCKIREEFKLPSMIRSENKPIGNEEKGNGVLPSFDSKPDSFFNKTQKFKNKLKSEKEGLGQLGMKNLGKSTFDKYPVKAGETPTISNGIPVGELKGQFENVNIRQQAGDQFNQTSNQVSPVTQRYLQWAKGKPSDVVQQNADLINQASVDLITGRKGQSAGRQMAQGDAVQRRNDYQQFKNRYQQPMQMQQPMQQQQQQQMQQQPMQMQQR